MEECFSGTFRWSNTGSPQIYIFAYTHMCYANMTTQHTFRRQISGNKTAAGCISNGVMHTTNAPVRLQLLLLTSANPTLIISRRTKRMLKKNKRNKLPTIYRPSHPQRSQNKVGKYSHDRDWQQKGQWYGLANLDMGVSENVWNIQQSYNLHYKCHERLEHRIESGMSNPSKEASSLKTNSHHCYSL